MKRKYLLIAPLMLMAFTNFAQPTAGMVGHWDMNGTSNDMSGGGHHGHMNNLVSAAGQDGVAGHAWYFNGVNSSITLPYFSQLNVTQFTIAASFKVSAFYTGPCHGNTLFIRGKTNGNDGSYLCQFTDYPAGYGCTTAIDTTQESFVTAALGPGGAGLTVPPPFTAYDHTPHVTLNEWYNLVVTFDGTKYKTYINGVLKTDVPNPTPSLTMGSNTDSAAIGFAPYDDAVGYPYRFKGIIDDIKLYNTALSSCDVARLSNWAITSQPVHDTTSPGSTATFAISDSGTATTYQWQVNTGAGGFTDCPATAPYSGVTTPTLTITPTTTAMNNYLYRCLRANTTGCHDTSAAAKLLVSTVSVNDLRQKSVAIVPNPAHDVISLTSAIAIDKVEITDITGRRLITEYPASNTATVDIQSLSKGIYLIRINDNFTSRFVKE